MSHVIEATSSSKTDTAYIKRLDVQAYCSQDIYNLKKKCMEKRCGQPLRQLKCNEMSVILSEFTVLRRLRVSKHSHDISELPEWILGTSVT